MSLSSSVPGFADFAERVGTEFALRLSGGESAPLVLTECAALDLGSYSLIFKAGRHAPKEQGTYELSADDFEPGPIFLVPVTQRPDDALFPFEYQAIFNASSVSAGRPDTPHSHNRLEEEQR